MANDTQATFSVVLDDKLSGPAEEAAQAVDELRASMSASEQNIKSMSAALRQLRGSSDEVKAAKAKLGAQLEKERQALSKGQLATLKNADSIKKLDERKKQDAARSAKLLEIQKKVKEQHVKDAASMDKLTSAGSALLGISVGLAAAFGAAATSFAAFVIKSADAARSAGLLREALTVGFAGGGAQNGSALGSQIDALSRKLPTSKAALQDLAGTLTKGRLEGQTLVDTFNAIGQASAAVGDDAGSKLKSLVERGAVTKRFSVGDDRFSDDLLGTGLQRDDVAKSLSKNLNIGIADARKALAQGRVKLADGAKALADATNEKFGAINTRKMLSLPVIFAKLEEKLTSLANKVDLEPLLNGLESFFDLFDEHTVTGDAIKQLVTLLGSGLAGAVGQSSPTIKSFFKGMIIQGLELAIRFYELKAQIKGAFSDLSGIISLNDALKYGKIALTGIAAVAILVAGAFAAMAAAVLLPIAAYVWLQKKSEEFGASLRDIDWAATGRAIIDGLINGLKGGAHLLESTVSGLGDKVKKGFREALGIRSPSKVFADFGDNTVAGFAQGVDRSAPDAQRAVNEMTSTPSSGAVSASRGAVTINMPVTINASGGADVAKQLVSPDFRAQFTKMLEEALIGAGVPV